MTALQLVFMDLLKSWGVHPTSVIGHSSGEIAAAVAAGVLEPEEAIKIAYYRGYAAKLASQSSKDACGMLAVGLDAHSVMKYIDSEDEIEIACYNGPSSITLSGSSVRLQAVHEKMQADSVFSRILLVDLAYHSSKMLSIAANYEVMLDRCFGSKSNSTDDGSVRWYSTVANTLISAKTCGNSYWKQNMIQPVLFNQTLETMLQDESDLGILLEIGPSNTLEAPVLDIVETSGTESCKPSYLSICKRGKEAFNCAINTAGKLYSEGCTVDTCEVNNIGKDSRSLIVDLPNYSWNHSSKYWHEGEASRDWRHRRFPIHDLIGTKILGTPWDCPIWHKKLRLSDLTWLNDHKVTIPSLEDRRLTIS